MNDFINLDDKKIFRIGLGTSNIGGYFTADKTQLEKESLKKINNFFHIASDLGFNFIDTAETYAQGETEKIIGSLAGSIKDKFIIASKFSLKSSSLSSIEKSLDGSLKRLRKEYVDIYMPHWPLESINLEKIYECLFQLKYKGKIKYIGFSNYDRYINELFKFSEVNFIESEFNPLYQIARETIFPKLNNERIFIGYSPFKNGQLFSHDSIFYKTLFDKSRFYNLSISQLILIWILNQNTNLITIPKTSKIDRLYDFMEIRAISKKLKEEIFKDLDKNLKIKIVNVKVNKIKMTPDRDRPIYYNLNEAIENRFNLKPDVIDISKEIVSNSGRLLKPIVLKREKGSSNYFCIDGRLKFWAWVYLNGTNSQIPAIIN